MAKLIVILLIGLFCEAVGVVFLSRGLKQIGEVKQVNFKEVVRIVKAGATNKNILVGIFFDALFFASLLIMMSKSDVSFVWPLTALGFVLTTLAAKFFLQEQVSATRWAGVILIMAGAGLITWTEHEKTKPGTVPLDPAPITKVPLN
jgi:drug/metabolite transporter (DMT)-like permease